MQISPNLLRVIFMLSTIVYVTDCCSSRILLLRRHTLTFVQHVHQHQHQHQHPHQPSHQHQNHGHAAASPASQLQQKQPQHVNLAASDGREFNHSRSGEFHGRQDDNHNNNNNNNRTSSDDATAEPDAEVETEAVTEWDAGLDLSLVESDPESDLKSKLESKLASDLESELESEFESRFESIMDLKPAETAKKFLSTDQLQLEAAIESNLERELGEQIVAKSDPMGEAEAKANLDRMSRLDRLLEAFNDSTALGGPRDLAPPTADPPTTADLGLGLNEPVTIADPAGREQAGGEVEAEAEAEGEEGGKNPKYHVIDFYYTIMRDVLSFECIGQFLTDFCLNGGRCFRYPIGNHSFFSCECADGFVGERCESKSVNELYLPAAVTPPKILMARMVFSFPMLVVLCVVYGAVALLVVLRGPLKRGSPREEGVLEG